MKFCLKDQFGFRAKFSTEYATADIHDKLIRNLDEGLNSCAIFLDLAKAFNSVTKSYCVSCNVMASEEKH